MRRVVPGEVRVGVRVAEVVDGYDRNVMVALGFIEGAEKFGPCGRTIDCNFDGHPDDSQSTREQLQRFLLRCAPA